MKKVIKLLSLIMAMVLCLTMFTACNSSNNEEGTEDEETLKPFTMTIGIPVDENDSEWADWESVLDEWTNDFDMFYKINLKFVKVPTEEREMKSFLNRVKSGKIACFIAPQGTLTDRAIDREVIIDLTAMRNRYNAILEGASDAIFTLSQASDLKNYMYPLAGTYQGLYYNRTLFKELGLKNPTSWENLLEDIAALKEKGITPIAAGFQDEGLNYLMEELILSEGGTAEHSYSPAFGVVSSWERAAADLKTLEDLGAFTTDCYNVDFKTAVQSFLDGKAAMIVAPSTAFGEDLSRDDTKVVGFPATPTGKREEGAFIGRLTTGVYVSKTFFNKTDTRYPEAIVELLGSDYLGSATLYNLLADDSTISAQSSHHDDLSNLDSSLSSLLKKAKNADWPMTQHLYTYDNLVDAFRSWRKGNGELQALLQAAADAEIAEVQAAEQEK